MIVRLFSLEPLKKGKKGEDQMSEIRDILLIDMWKLRLRRTKYIL